MAAAQVRVFELDHPEVLGFKQGVLGSRTATVQHVPMGTDLREGWPAELVARGFRPDLPTAWLVEGLLVYLSAHEAEQLFATIGELSAPASRIGWSTSAGRCWSRGRRPTHSPQAKTGRCTHWSRCGATNSPRTPGRGCCVTADR
ncbi:SAM-dependent methyltransferase [Actinophytocola xanthii]|uniref:S-adenosyl-L-methionine-dependent methyltransferase n=1 Tax=Actinophytocola xanthii TaxID=1912961 RepID=A0A1Q8CTG9_9PSEU|nr:hypothetical protein BU204_10600 [Actinophytocola xanthii]